jgi:hypothetical protein
MIWVTTVGTGLPPVVVGGAGVGGVWVGGVVDVDPANALLVDIERIARANGRQSFRDIFID